MSLIQWEPFWAQDDMLDRAAHMLARWPRMPGDDGAARWSPSADISETDREYLIRAQLPAVKKEDVKVTVDDDVITISGERKETQEQKNEKRHRVESFYGSFSRSFMLPGHIKAEAVKAESRDGVLTVHVPKSKPTARPAAQIKVE